MHRKRLVTLNGYKFEFSPKFGLSNLKRIRQVAALSLVTLASAGLVIFIFHMYSLGDATGEI